MHVAARPPNHACVHDGARLHVLPPPQASYARNNRLLFSFQGVKGVSVCYYGKEVVSDGLEKDGQRPRFNLHTKIKEAVFEVGAGHAVRRAEAAQRCQGRVERGGRANRREVGQAPLPRT